LKTTDYIEVDKRSGAAWGPRKSLCLIGVMVLDGEWFDIEREQE
jgi:hypothetical protein